MIKSLMSQDRPPQIELLFGCRFRRDTLLLDRVKQHHAASTIGITVCVSRETPANGMKRGRVTDVLRTRNLDAEDTDFYICGNPSMISDAVTILIEKGARNIFREEY